MTRLADAPLAQGRANEDATVELDRLPLPVCMLDNGAADTLLVIKRTDGWAFYGRPGREFGVHLAPEAMCELVRLVVEGSSG